MAVDQVTTNRNFLSQLNFRFNVRKIPNVSFYVQKVNLPGVQLPAVPVPNPFVQIPQTGDHIVYGQLSLTFRVDEDFQNWLEIYNWIKGEGFPNEFPEYRSLSGGSQRVTGTGVKSDLTLLVLNSTKNVNYEFTFIEGFPVYLSDLDFSTMDQDVDYIEAHTVFNYIDFSAKRL